MHSTALLLAMALGCSNHVPKLDELDPASQDAARATIAAMVQAHGGREAWLALDDMQAVLSDTWHQPSFAPPYPEHSGLELTWNAELDKAHLAFLGSEHRWGHDSVEGWTATGAHRTYELVDMASFTVPTMAYFLNLPYRLVDDGLYYRQLEDVEQEGRVMHQVAISFEPHLGTVTDRYLVRIDARSKQLVDVAFTVMDQGPLPQAIAHYRSFHEVDGVDLPELVDIDILRPGLFAGPLHSYTVLEYRQVPTWDRSRYEKPPG